MLIAFGQHSDADGRDARFARAAALRGETEGAWWCSGDRERAGHVCERLIEHGGVVIDDRHARGWRQHEVAGSGRRAERLIRDRREERVDVMALRIDSEAASITDV